MKRATKNIASNLYERYSVLNKIEKEIENAFEALLVCARNDGLFLVCGNGGSSSDAGHIVGELMKGFMLPRCLDSGQKQKLARKLPRDMSNVPDMLQYGIRSVSLSSQTSLITAIANDVSDQMIFAQQVFVYGRPNDVLIGISTSGRAQNVVNAIAIGKAIGITTIAISGNDGGRLKDLADITIIAPSVETYLIQELQLPIYHTLCAMLEMELFG